MQQAESEQRPAATPAEGSLAGPARTLEQKASARVHHLDFLRASMMILGVFVLAFLTFFGVPFVSTAPHKGAI